jgi:hypothetical protein
MLKSFLRLRKFLGGPELWDAGIYSRQDAKNAKLKDFFLGGLCAFARDNPRLNWREDHAENIFNPSVGARVAGKAGNPPGG